MDKECDNYMEYIALLTDDQDIELENKDAIIQHINNCFVCKTHYNNLLFLKKSLSNIEEIELPENFHDESMKLIKKSITKDLEEKKAKEKIKLINVKEMKFITEKKFRDNIKYNNKNIVVAASIFAILFVIGSSLYFTNPQITYDSPQLTMSFNAPINYAADTTTNIVNDDSIIITNNITITANEHDAVTNILSKYDKNSINRNDYQDQSAFYINQTLALPLDQYKVALEEIRSLGNVTYEQESKVSVSNQITDLSLRIKAKETEQKRVMSLIPKTEKISDMMLVDNRVNQITEDLDILKAQLNSLNKESSNPKIFITIVEKNKFDDVIKPRLYTRVQDSFYSSIRDTSSFVENTIVNGASLVMPIIILAILIGGVLLLTKRKDGQNDKEKK